MTLFEWLVIVSALLGALRVLREGARRGRAGADGLAEGVVAVLAAGLLAVLGVRTAGAGLIGGVVAACGMFLAVAPRRLLARLMPDVLPLFSDPDPAALPLAAAVTDASKAAPGAPPLPATPADRPRALPGPEPPE